MVTRLLRVVRNLLQRKKCGAAARVIVTPKPVAKLNAKRNISIVIDAASGTVIEEPALNVRQSASIALFEPEEIYRSRVPLNLPKDIAQLAARNKAFLDGLLAVQHMNLDEDLFQQAFEDLKIKYDKS